MYKKLFLFCSMMAFAFGAAAQEDGLVLEEPDSLITVPPPPAYQIPISRLDSSTLGQDDQSASEEGEVVPGALSSPDAYQLQFDTLMARELFELDLNDYYVPRVPEDLIKDRLACLENGLPLVYRDRIKVFIDFYAVRRRDFTLRVMRRKNIYFPIFEKVLAEYNMPDELKYLSIIESALIPTARSRVGAVGLWQFMPATGRSFGLKQSSYIDERRDPEKATRAACRYLKQLYNMFDNWELAVAAYNCGPGNVRKAIRRSGYKKTFWGVYRYLPRETRSYLPQLIAMIYVINYANEHHLIQDEPDYPIEASTVYVNGLVDLGILADKLQICAEDMLLLNPELKRGAVPPYAKDYPLKLPTARYQYFLDHKQEILELASQSNTYDTQLMSKSGGLARRYDGIYYHIVRKGEDFSFIAEKNGVDASDLITWNKMQGKALYPGQKLVVYTSPSGKPPKKKPIYGDQVYHKVQRGETLGSIAKKYRVYVSQLRAWNGLNGDRIYIGQRLNVKASKSISSSVNKTVSTKKPSNTGYHTVRRGESLGIIASRYGMGISQLRAWNNLRGNTIYPGQKLSVKAGTAKTAVTASSKSSSSKSVHVVRSGDSLWTIAKEYGTSVDKLKQLNGLSSSRLKINQRLRVK